MKPTPGSGQKGHPFWDQEESATAQWLRAQTLGQCDLGLSLPMCKMEVICTYLGKIFLKIKWNNICKGIGTRPIHKFSFPPLPGGGQGSGWWSAQPRPEGIKAWRRREAKLHPQHAPPPPHTHPPPAVRWVVPVGAGKEMKQQRREQGRKWEGVGTHTHTQ